MASTPASFINLVQHEEVSGVPIVVEHAHVQRSNGMDLPHRQGVEVAPPPLRSRWG